MFWFKACPRCSGDLYEESDQYGRYVTCAQCGFTKDIFSKLEDPAELSPEPVPVPAVPKFEKGKRRRLSHGGRHSSKTFAFREEISVKNIA